MKRSALIIALCAAASFAHAKGVPYAVPTFEKAQQVSKQDSTKHVLVFYTHEL